MKKALKKIYFEGELFICFLCFFVMLVLLIYQVILRFVFNASNAWSEELARYLFVYIVFLSSSAGVLYDKPVKIEIFEKLFPGVTRKISAFLGDIIWIVFCTLLTIWSFDYIRHDVYGFGIVSIGLKGKMWPWWSALIIGNALITIRKIIKFIEDWFLKRPLVSPEEQVKIQDEAEVFLDEIETEEGVDK